MSDPGRLWQSGPISRTGFWEAFQRLNRSGRRYISAEAPCQMSNNDRARPFEVSVLVLVPVLDVRPCYCLAAKIGGDGDHCHASC